MLKVTFDFDLVNAYNKIKSLSVNWVGETFFFAKRTHFKLAGEGL